MKSFEELDQGKQLKLLAELLMRLSGELAAQTIDQVAAKRSQTVSELWADICNVCGVEQCWPPKRSGTLAIWKSITQRKSH